MTNSTWEVYGSESQDVGILEVTIDENCIPTDGITRIVSVDNIYMTLPDNPDEDRHVQFYSEHTEGGDRREIINYKNNVHENIESSIYSMFDVYLQPNVEVNIKNNTFINISGLYGGFYIYNTGNIDMSDTFFINTTNFGFGLASFEEINGNGVINRFTTSINVTI